MADLKQLARSIFTHALAECSIDRAFDRILHITADTNGMRLILNGEDPIALDRLQRLRIVAIGKAAAPMLQALLSRLPLPSACDLAGVLVAPKRPPALPQSIQFFPGGHPTPNEASFAGASAALSMLQALGASSPDETVCIFLISGGASSMMELPLDPSISLDDTIQLYRALVHSGASIVEINCVRKHFSAIKGGRLALAAGSARRISLLVSDVPPEHLDALASGPTIADPTTVAECREILIRYDLLEQLPSSVRRYFASPDLPESPKPGTLISPAWKLLSSDELAKAAQDHATALGFRAIIDNTCDDWPFDRAADYLLDRLRTLRSEHPRVCLISAGEITVQVPHAFSSGRGGRNQHFAVYATTRVTPEDAPIAILSAGSDGIDGNSAAAGAAIDASTAATGTRRAAAERVLNVFDSSTWLDTLGATIVTGPTGHNLRDLRILLADSDS